MATRNWADESSEDELDSDIEVEDLSKTYKAPFIAEINFSRDNVNRLEFGKYFEALGCKILKLEIQNRKAFFEFGDAESIHKCLKEDRKEILKGLSIKAKVFVSREESSNNNNRLNHGDHRDRNPDIRAIRNERSNDKDTNKFESYSRDDKNRSSKSEISQVNPEINLVRPKIIIQPRTLPLETIGAPINKPDIFGGGKPHDEAEYEERKQKLLTTASTRSESLPPHIAKEEIATVLEPNNANIQEDVSKGDSGPLPLPPSNISSTAREKQPMERHHQIGTSLEQEKFRTIPMSLIQKLNNDLTREVWSYLVIKDICCLIITNKYIRTMSLRVNEVVSQEIFFYLHYWSEEIRGKMLRNMIFNFPNIYKLALKWFYNNRIGQSLRKLYSCESICLSLRDLTVSIGSDEGVKGISCLRNIKYLNISKSLITNNGMSEIGSMIGITSLDCSSCENIGNDGLLHISKLINLKSLNISGIDRITDSGLSYLSCLTNMTLLNISCCKITTLLSISSMTSMTYLNLSYCGSLTDEGFTYVSSLVNMTSLDISNCKITTLFPISSLTNMTTLNLSECFSLRDVGLSFISSLVNITSLNLYNCDYITTLFPISTLTNMTTLILSNCCNLTDLGLSNISSLINLTRLDLFQCSITTLFPISYLMNITSLILSNCCNLTDQGLSHISSLTNLTRLDLFQCNITSLFPISSLTNITSLILSECQDLTDDGFSFISSLISLTSLNTSDCKITSLFPISSLTKLTSLNISECYNLKDKKVSHISLLINLTDLNMSGCRSITENRFSFVTSLMKILKLDIINCNIINNDGLYYISYLTNIQILEMTLRNEMTNEGFDYLYKLKNLNKISFINHQPSPMHPYTIAFKDINLSPIIIEKFLNMKEFRLIESIKRVYKVKGFYHIQELRNQRQKEKMQNANLIFY